MKRDDVRNEEEARSKLEHPQPQTCRACGVKMAWDEDGDICDYCILMGDGRKEHEA